MNLAEKPARTLIGEVTSISMKDTIVVKVEDKVKHPLYSKYIKRSIKFHAHDHLNSCKKGDQVLIKEYRPISKTKSWILVKILEKAI